MEPRPWLADARAAKAAKKSEKDARPVVARSTLGSKQPAQSPPAVHVSKKVHLSATPEPTTITPSGLFENEVSTNFFRTAPAE